MRFGNGTRKEKEKEKEKERKEKEKAKAKENMIMERAKERSLMEGQTTTNRMGPGHLIGGAHLHGIQVPLHLHLNGHARLRWTLEL